jgi:broad specificity phosphatase PhoE
MDLLLLAHAATPAMRSGRFPSPADRLDAASARDAAAVAAWVAGWRADRFLHAPAAPAAETAMRVHGGSAEVCAEICPALREPEYGSWAGRTLREVFAADPSAAEGWLRDPRAAPPDGESMALLRERVGAWLDGLPATRDRLLAVAAPVVVRAALAAVLELPRDRMPPVEVGPLAALELRRRGTWHLIGLHRPNQPPVRA